MTTYKSSDYEQKEDPQQEEAFATQAKPSGDQSNPDPIKPIETLQKKLEELNSNLCDHTTRLAIINSRNFGGISKDPPIKEVTSEPNCQMNKLQVLIDSASDWITDITNELDRLEQNI